MSKEIAALGITGMINSMIAKEVAGGAAREDAIKLALLEVGKIMFVPRGRAMQYLGHFLGGSGSSIEVDWRALEKEDKNVHARVHAEIVRRALGMDTIIEGLVKGTPAEQDRSTITLFQSTYAIQDWQFALGTFGIQFVVNKPTRTPDPFVSATIWGSNEYKWYASEDRVTKRIHEVAQELVEKRKARPFQMFLRPTELLIPINSANLLFGTAGFQNNPKAHRPLLSSEQYKAASKKADELGYASILLNAF